MKVKVKFKYTNKIEHDELISIMESNINIQNNPKVGIFWVDIKTYELFGIVSQIVHNNIKPNSGGNKYSCSELHKYVWAKKFNKQKIKGNIGPYVGDYKETPRGRIFYNLNNNIFEICVGDWFKKLSREEQSIVEENIIDEFDLINSKYCIIIDYHWDIGSGWENI